MATETLILSGIVLIGLGLGLQGWFILDLNKRLTHIHSILLCKLQTIEERLGGGNDDSDL
jgi:hypothetical protein|tara:strand:- start:1375 stop:1554 length:180 start_codon:yes stop_codon:yes gene_type:complete